MATLAEKRVWLRENTSEEIPARGRLRPDLEALYDQAHQDGDWDLPGDPAADDPFAEPEIAMEPERTPRTPRADRAARRARPAATRVDGWVGRLMGAPKDKGKGTRKKPKPRISLENFTARAYAQLGRIVRPISPATGNCLQAQAAMAGILLEDIARDTIVDRLLQGPARLEDKLDKGFALIVPPLAVFAIEQNQAAVAAGARTPQQGMMRHAMIMPVLREGLRVGLEVSEAYADQIKARLEREARFDAEIDELIGLIFGQIQAEAEPASEPEPQMAGTAA